MSACVICSGEHDADPGTYACQRCAGRLAGALRQLPTFVDELRTELVPDDDARDPVAVVLPAGPQKGAWRESRIRSTRPERLPVSVDVVDLTAPARVFRLAGRPAPPPAAAETCRWCRERHQDGLHRPRPPQVARDRMVDQDGHTSVASVLDFWVRDWADLRGEGLPPVRTRERSPVAQLAGWLALRLDWALRHHPALDEFARDVGDLFGALWAIAGRGPARPKLMEAECPACGLATLQQPFPEAYIECSAADCGRCLTPSEYEEYVMDMRHEITAVDVLTVLNGLERPKLDGLTFAVITKGYTESSGQGRAQGQLIQHEERFWPFERGEIVVLNGNGREPFGEGRKPGKWSVEFEEFLTLDGALKCRDRLLAEPGEESAFPASGQ